MQAEQLPRLSVEVITARYRQHFADSARVHPVHTNRASELGHPCLRYLVLLRTSWREQKPPDADLMLIFNEGKHQERALIQDLQAAGFDLQESQKSHEWPRYQITGHLDWYLRLDGFDGSLLCEAKSMNPHIFDAVNTVADMIHSPHFWVRKYPAQIMLYLLLDGRGEAGVFILKNKTSGQIKVIECALDYEYAESLLKKAESVNAHVAAGTLPDFIGVEDQSVCDRCAFYGRTCQPPRSFAGGLQILDNPELERQLTLRESLKAASAEYAATDKRVKEQLRGLEHGVCGDFVIEGKATKVGWTTKITRHGAGEGSE